MISVLCGCHSPTRVKRVSSVASVKPGKIFSQRGSESTRTSRLRSFQADPSADSAPPTPPPPRMFCADARPHVLSTCEGAPVVPAAAHKCECHLVPMVTDRCEPGRCSGFTGAPAACWWGLPLSQAAQHYLKSSHSSPVITMATCSFPSSAVWSCDESASPPKPGSEFSRGLQSVSLGRRAPQRFCRHL